MNDKDKKDKEKVYKIFVNTREKTTTLNPISFEEVVKLADNLISGPMVEYTVTYRKAEDKAEGSLVAGKSVKIKDGTIFNVTATDKS